MDQKNKAAAVKEVHAVAEAPASFASLAVLQMSKSPSSNNLSTIRSKHVMVPRELHHHGQAVKEFLDTQMNTGNRNENMDHSQRDGGNAVSQSKDELRVSFEGQDLNQKMISKRYPVDKELSIKSHNEQSFGAQSDMGMLSNAGGTLHNHAAKFVNIGGPGDGTTSQEKEVGVQLQS